MDSAKRDLRSLSATENPTPLRKDSGLGSTELPSLSTPASLAPTDAPGANTAPSPTWLQDALDARKAEDTAAQRKETEATLNRTTLPNQKTSLTPDPFDRYLTQWLSPRDMEILRPDAKKENLDQNKLLREPSALNSGKDISFSAPAPTPFTPSGSGTVATNPYLPELEPVAPLATGLIQSSPTPTPAVAQSSPVRQTGLSPMLAPGDTTGSPTPPQTQIQGPTVTPPVPPPTAPVVDDRKYFPQLRRF